MPIPRLFVFCTLTLIVAFFWNVLVGTEQFAFRDGAHFYGPLYRYTQTYWATGRVPLWMPYENLGQPLLANPVSAVFYPPKILFCLPFDFTNLYHVFVVLHVALASATMYRLARNFQISESGSTLAGISYAFSGAVLYQHLNIVFLIGAAWFPELLRCAFVARRLKKFSFGIPFCLAMMILGGDIQAAYHGVIAVFLILGFRKALAPLVFAFLLTTVQTLPSWELAQHCNRARGSSAASVWSAWNNENQVQVLDGLLCRNLSQRGHARAIYNFSVSPWKIFEWVWPNFSGRFHPQNTRWTSGTVWDRFVWVPSLYCGVIPFLLVLDTVFRAVFFKVSGFTQRKTILLWFLTFVVLLLGSFGIFGLCWCVNVGCYGATTVGDTSCGAGHPVGGVYWLMNVLLPGYAQFRYPAKLLTVTMIPLGLLAAFGFDRVFLRRSGASSLVTISVTTLFVSPVMLAVLQMTPLWDNFVQNIPRCRMFGPFQSALAKTQLSFSLFHTTVMLFVFVAIIWWCRKTKKGTSFLPCVLVLFTATDIFVANRNMVPTVDRKYFRYESPLLKIIEQNRDTVPPRIYRYSIWYPPVFAKTSSPERLEESVLFDRLSLWPKYTLENRITVLNVVGTMSIQTYSDHLRTMRSAGPGIEKRLAYLGCCYVIVPNRVKLNPRHAEKIVSDPAYDVALWEIKKPAPALRFDAHAGRAWISRYEPDRIIIETDLTQAQTLVLAEQFWPGWKAFLVQESTEKEIEIFPVENVFRGVKVPPGKNTVTFRYEPFSYTCGAMISGGTWLIFCAVYLFSRRRAGTEKK